MNISIKTRLKHRSKIRSVLHSTLLIEKQATEIASQFVANTSLIA